MPLEVEGLVEFVQHSEEESVKYEQLRKDVEEQLGKQREVDNKMPDTKIKAFKRGPFSGSGSDLFMKAGDTRIRLDQMGILQIPPRRKKALNLK